MEADLEQGDIVGGYVPGSIGRVTELHGSYYHAEWGFEAFFEAKVAEELAAFVTDFVAGRDGFWTVSVRGRVEAAIAIDGTGADRDGARLRWFIVSDALRGHGLGRRLLRTATDFCRASGHPGIHLWTFDGLDAARHLYESEGFELAEQRIGSQWGRDVLEQRFRLELLPTSLNS